LAKAAIANPWVLIQPKENFLANFLPLTMYLDQGWIVPLAQKV